MYGVGDVVVEGLRDVWKESSARINNSMDHSVTPFPAQKGEVCVCVFKMLISTC